MQEIRYNIVQIKQYGPDNYKLTLCKRLATGQKEELDKNLQLQKTQKNNTREKLLNNISRAKNTIMEYALCNHWDYFVTLTLDSKKYDRDDLDKFVKDLGQFIRDYRKKHGIRFSYLLIPELHADGKSWHMHGLFTDIPSSDLAFHPVLDQAKKGYSIWKPYNEKFGFCSVSKIRDDLKTGIYITKYINKDLSKSVRESGKKLYYCSRGLQKSGKVEEFQLRNALPFEFPFDGPFSKSIFIDSLQLAQLIDMMDSKQCRKLND